MHSRPAKNVQIPDKIPFGGAGYYLISFRVRRYVLCGEYNRKACEKHKLNLHMNTCFQMFHEQ